MVTATFRFYEELNDFLPPDRRKVGFTCACAREATVKHMIEALGVPHTEVELILVNGASVDFGHRLREGDRVAVYPKFESLDIRPLLRLREQPLREVRFIADAHLGGLARLLRLAGFDTRYDNHIRDEDLVAIALREGRIVLTRDIELLKRRDVTHGCYVHALKAELQLKEIFGRLDLAGAMRPFSLCLACNAPLRPIAKSEVLDRLPERVRASQARFATCDVCRRVFWEGSHWRRMSAVLARVVAEAAGGGLV